MSETNYDTLFGRMVLEQGLCTEEELSYSRKTLKERPKDEPVTLEQIMLRSRFITPNQAKRIKETTKESKDAANHIPGYKILGKLGAGAMAIVYKAKQISLDRIVAVKILPKRFSENPDYVQRFYKEGKAAAKLNHNNIVGAYDVGEAGSYHYFAMEYVEGKTLYEDLAKGYIFPEKEAIEIITQVSRALAHAHSKGLIHRDVKPKNIMINTAGVVKLADLGLARDSSDVQMAKNEAGKAYGTPYYIAPEQIRGEIDIDQRADLYALGVTFYHMVTGRVPFEATTPSEVMKKHLKEPLIPPDHINTSLSTGISEVIEVLMAKNKNDRYNSAEELLVDLEAISSGGTPLKAHKKFDLDSLEQLEQGDSIELDDDENRYYDESIVSKYRTITIILSSIIAILVLMVIFLFSSK